jgi:hypothetical protein
VGAGQVEFIPETGAHKTPDLKVVKGTDIFYVESASD